MNDSIVGICFNAPQGSGMKFTYLLINIFTIIIPVLRSGEAKLRFYHKLRYFLPGMFFTGLFFIVWDYFKAKQGVWVFNDRYILGLRFFGLPVEEFLFFITVPYACTFTYEAVSYFFGQRITAGRERYIVWGISLLAIVSAVFCRHKAYTFSVLLIAGMIFPLATLLLRRNTLNVFFIAYFISLIPMAIVNGLLTCLPVVTYDNSQNLGIRIGTIPVEDFLYAAILLVMNISLYQVAKDYASIQKKLKL